MRTSTKTIRFVNQQINPLAPLEQTLNVLTHNPPHIINLSLHIANRILLPRLRRPIINHQALQLAIKAARAIIRQAGEIRALGRELR